MYNWYKIFNLTEFLSTNLVSKEYTLELVGVGVKTILATQGNTNSITYDDVMLSINMNAKNPFQFEGKAVFLDESNDVWLGLPV